MKQKLKSIVAWLVLHGPTYVGLTLVLGILLGAIVFWLYQIFLHPALLVMLAVVILVVYGVEKLIPKVEALWGRIKKWCIDTLKPSDAEIATWAGTGPDDVWYVEARQGGAKAGPMSLTKAVNVQDRLSMYWGPCDLKHKIHYEPDPMLEDLAKLNILTAEIQKMNDDDAK